MSYKNPEDAKANKHRRYLAHREEVIAQSAKWQKDNPERRAQQRENRREKHNEEMRQYYYENKQKVLDYQTQWRADNPEKKRSVHVVFSAPSRTKAVSRLRIRSKDGINIVEVHEVSS